MDTEVKVELLLTNELMIMISIDDDSQQQAFSLVELEVKVEPDNPQLITFVWRDSFHQDVPQVGIVTVEDNNILTLKVQHDIMNIFYNINQFSLPDSMVSYRIYFWLSCWKNFTFFFDFGTFQTKFTIFV